MTVGTSPGPIECFGHAWQQLKRAFVPMLAVTTGWAIAGALAGRVPSGWPRLLVQALFAGPIGIGAMGASLRVARGQTPEPGDLLAAFRRDWAQAALLCLLLGCAVAVGSMFLVVPGIWIGLRLSWAPYLFLDERLEAVDAVRESFRRTRGHAVSLLGLWAISGAVVAVGLALLLVGAIPATAWAQTALAAYYLGARGR